MTLRDVAVVQTRGVPALDAVLAALAALVYLDRHAIAHLELVHSGPQRRHRAGVLVSHDERTVGLPEELAVQNLHVGSADGGDVDLEQDLPRSRIDRKSVV